MRTLILATRGSALAMAQAASVKELLEATGKVSVTIQTVTTKGDRDRVSDLVKIGGNGLFVRGVEEEVLQGHADLAVHCGKDLPFELASGLTIAGVPAAASSADCIIARAGSPLLTRTESQMMEQAGNPLTEPIEGGSPEPPAIGTGSPRRIHELQRLYPGAVFRSIRGNITTRIRKLSEGYDGIVLAKAGLERLGLLGPEGKLAACEGFGAGELEIREFSPEECLPACTQGILALECRKEDEELTGLLRSISDPASELRFRAERTLFCLLRADCTEAVGIHSDLFPGGRLALRALYQGRYAETEGDADAYEEICRMIFRQLTGVGKATFPFRNSSQ